jgi:hypothetical protein
LVTIPRAPHKDKAAQVADIGELPYRDVPGHSTAASQTAFFHPATLFSKMKMLKVKAKYDCFAGSPFYFMITPSRLLLENEWNAEMSSRLGVVVLCMIQKCRHIILIAATKSKIFC